LSDLELQWRDTQYPRYRKLVADAAADAETATPPRLAELVDIVGREAGIYLWYLAVVGGSAWKMEACLTRFARQHLAEALPQQDGGAQVLLRGLPGTQPLAVPHAVQSVDWYHPVAGELPSDQPLSATVDGRHRELAEQRAAAEQRSRKLLADRPRVLSDFDRLLEVTQRYAVIREEQARDFTLGWPVLRTCARRLGQYLTGLGVIERPDEVFFCTRNEINSALADIRAPISAVDQRCELWQRQRRLSAPLTLGRPARLIGDVIDRAVQEARGAAEPAEGVILGHPASAGRATGPVHIVYGPDDFAAFGDGDVLVAKATSPAWTPLFAAPPPWSPTAAPLQRTPPWWPANTASPPSSAPATPPDD
jgi:hypothetical protein